MCERRIHYAKDKVSRSYFYNFNGVRYGIRHDLLGGMANHVFLDAFHELVIMGPVAFILDFFLYGSLSKKLAFRIVNPAEDKPIMIILAISSITVCLMCPSMSLVATLLFKNPGKEVIAIWLQTTALNFPMAFFWQIFFAGPLVRKIFGAIFK